jgi:hypothetical protein
MTTKTEALKLALGALEKLAKLGNGDTYGNSIGNVIAQAAIALTQEALAQPEQEPVAWAYVNSDDECEQIEYCKESPVNGFIPLYTSPPKREWVGLTLTDFEKLEQLYGHQVSNDFAFANIVCQVESLLKELNHG